MSLNISLRSFLSTAAVAAGLTLAVTSSAAPGGGRSRISGPIDDHVLMSLSGNVRPEVATATDHGIVGDLTPLEHMQLLLKRSDDSEAALESLIIQLHDPASRQFHQWLTAEQFGEKFGVASSDLNAVSSWLTGHGFTVNVVYANGLVIDFSGTAGQVRAAFHTDIHSLQSNGGSHIANVSEPQIPAALGAVVKGVVSLHDFRPKPMSRMRTEYTFTSGGSTYHAVVPADLAKIYNLTPLFSAGISGQGQTIVVIEDTNVYSTSDFTTFRSTFGLSSYTAGSLTTVHPAPASGSNNCTNPGVVTGNDGEAELDAEWASAAAPSATIEVASCKDTSTTFGGLIALQNLLTASSPPAIVSISYGECEAENGATANAAYVSAYQQAVAEGVSVFVSSGDEGAASCDAGASNATHGIGVSGFASTPYNVAVGGTDFGDTYAGTTSTYWSATNSSTYGSALSYIPEIPWNDSCASVLIAAAEGYSAAYGSSGFCNSSAGRANFLSTASGSGGPSNCATGKPSKTGVTGGTCKGTAKPSWQSVVGNPADGVRDIPDVSLFAANGVWGHYYVICYTHTAGGGAPCTGAPSGWAGAGGTSFSSPILAAIQALVNQHTAQRWGNPNPTYYSLAAAEYGTSGSTSCNSSNGSAVSSSCIFYDTTLGDIDVNCTGTTNCYKPSGTYGVLSTSTSSYAPAYKTTTGWDFATGLGTINAYNLVYGWP